MSRCICSPCWSRRASACCRTRASTCRHATGSAACPASGAGSCAAARGNQSAGTGSGARNAQMAARSAAAGSSARSRSNASWVTAVSDRGYAADRPWSRTWAARAASRSRYSAAGVPVPAMYPAAWASASGRSPSAGRHPARVRLAQPGHPVHQDRRRLGPGQWSPCTLVDRFPLCRIYIRNVNRLLKAHRAHFPQAALFPDAVVIPLDVVEYRGPGLFGIQPQMLVDELFLDRGVK